MRKNLATSTTSDGLRFRHSTEVNFTGNVIGHDVMKQNSWNHVKKKVAMKVFF
jgi:hypothetical protein